MEKKLKNLIEQLALDAQNTKNKVFYLGQEEGDELYADEVADIGFDSIVLLAESLGLEAGFDGVGANFRILPQDEITSIFPLKAAINEERLFHTIAPFVLDVFEEQVMLAQNLTQVYIQAIQKIRPDYSVKSVNTPDVQNQHGFATLEP